MARQQTWDDVSAECLAADEKPDNATMMTGGRAETRWRLPVLKMVFALRGKQTR